MHIPHPHMPCTSPIHTLTGGGEGGAALARAAPMHTSHSYLHTAHAHLPCTPPTPTFTHPPPIRTSNAHLPGATPTPPMPTLTGGGGGGGAALARAVLGAQEEYWRGAGGMDPHLALVR